MPDLSMRYRPLPNIVAEPVGSELVLLDLAGGAVYRLNATGRHVWEMAQRGRVPTEIAQELAAAHGLDAAQARADVVAVLSALLHNRLIASQGEADGEPTP